MKGGTPVNIEEKLLFFDEMLKCNYRVYLWSYCPDLTLIRTNCPSDLITSDVVSFLNFADSLMEYAKNGGRYPFILDTPLSLIWIAAFEYEDDVLSKIHMIGPAFTGKNSLLLMRKELDERELTVKLRSKIFQQLDDIPIIPTTTLFQYAVMFHYCITGERVSTNDIQFPDFHTEDPADDIRLISEEHRGIWLAEQTLIGMIRDGNPDYKKALEKSSALSNGIKFDVGDTMRQQKSSVHVLLTLTSRATIEGGLNPSISYTLSDYYSQRIENSKTTSELTALCRTMLEDYVQRVRQARDNSSVSRQIRNICDYITTHVAEKLLIDSLAEKAGYTEYYFSHKFKKEIGCSVNEFIQKEKLERAKLLLCSTKMGIQEISDELSFGSRSYFSSLFRSYTGISPSEYRENHLKI